jgi:3',5'-cyclic-AMP phosphodiesterase
VNKAPLRLIQLSDIHSFGKSDKTLLGVNPDQSFQALLDLIKNDITKNELIILSGDLAQDPSKETYERIAAQVSELNTPVYFVPGNHDDPAIIATVFPCGRISTQRTMVFDQWQIILLNSHKSGEVEGYLAQDQFDFLHESLEAYPEHYAMIVVHHHPIAVGCRWIDNSGLFNADKLWEFLKGYPQVRMILFGHIHQEHAGKKNGINYYSAPACCFQFKPNTPHFTLDPLPPGYRWVELYPRGEFNTGVQRLSQYIGRFEPEVTAY